jgi:hypothetical protein
MNPELEKMFLEEEYKNKEVEKKEHFNQIYNFPKQNPPTKPVQSNVNIKQSRPNKFQIDLMGPKPAAFKIGSNKMKKV